jgi:dipeptidyl aminopeptidase/acylaminoacyl peptidase
MAFEWHFMLVDLHRSAPRVAFRVDGASATGPSWSPDGRNIAFAAQSIYVGQPSTGDATRLTHPDTGAQLDDRCPAWSPDGRRIGLPMVVAQGRSDRTSAYSAAREPRCRWVRPAGPIFFLVENPAG